MKLSEIKILERGRDDAGYAQSVTSKGYDGLQPDEGWMDNIDVNITYTNDPDDSFDHEFGRENLEGAIWVDTLTLAAPAKQHDDDDKVIKTWPKGTDVTKLPGFKESDREYFQSELEKLVK